MRRVLYPERSYRDFAAPPPPPRPPRAAPDLMGPMIKFVFFVDNVDFGYRRMMMISRGKRVQ